MYNCAEFSVYHQVSAYIRACELYKVNTYYYKTLRMIWMIFITFTKKIFWYFQIHCLINRKVCLIYGWMQASIYTLLILKYIDMMI